jgi:DNA (cytosine-5)-methyltransferase 1
MTFLSLFAGIGGMDLGLERAGMKCIGQVEIDKFCRKVLKKHWPDVPKWKDVRKFNGDEIKEKPDLICGGFPCQDISNAGKQAGINGSRSGLWFEFSRIIRTIRPRYVLVENVAPLLVRGFSEVLECLAASGYDAIWDVLSASEFGAPHQRERVFIIAHFRKTGVSWGIPQKIHRVKEFSWCQNVRGLAELRKRSPISTPIFRGGYDGVPDWMDRVGALGNAVVPQVAEWIGRRIIEFDLK